MTTPTRDALAETLRAARELTAHIEDVLPDEAWEHIDTKTWNALTLCIGVFQELAPEIIDSPETGYPSRIIDGKHVPCTHDGRYLPTEQARQPEAAACDYCGRAKFSPAQAEQAVQEGWKLVPVEPTEEMRRAGGHANSEWLNDNAPIGEARYAMPMMSVYAAMLAAAPHTGTADEVAQ